MASDPDHAGNDPTDPTDRVEELLDSCLQKPEAEWGPAVEKVCEEHPELATSIRKRYSLLCRMGLVGELQSTVTDDLGQAARPRPRGLQEGEVFGEFRLLKRLGQGGMGMVFLAEQESMGRRVALKLIRPELLDHGKARARFRREVEAASRLDHPGICTVYEAGEVEGTPYIALRYVEGETLQDRLSRLRRPAGSTASSAKGTSTVPTSRDQIFAILSLVERAARALHLAHEEGMIHRDIKPGNIMVTPQGEPVLLDFGLARPEESSGDSLTMTGDVLGTPAYMSPEQISPKGRLLDRRSDVYSLAVTLYECLTLHHPFAAQTREELYRQVLSAGSPDCSRHNKAISRDLRIVVETAMARERDQRYQSALDFAEELRRVREFQPILARRAPLWARGLGWARREPVRAALLLALLLALAVGAGLSGYVLAKQGVLAEGQRALQFKKMDAALANGFMQAFEGTASVALGHFDLVLAEDAQNLEARAGRAMALTMDDKGAQALAYLGDPKEEDLQRVKAWVLRKLGQQQEAKTIDARLQKPTTVLGFFLAGAIESADGGLGDRTAFPRAWNHLQQAVLLSPVARQTYHVQLNHAADHLDDPQQMRACVTALEALWPETPATWRSIMFPLRKLDLPRALEVSQKYLAHNPGDYAIKTFQAHCLLDAKRLDEARSCLQRVFELNMRYGPAYESLGRLEKELGNHEEAIQAFHRAIRFHHDTDYMRCTLGNSLMALGKHAEAEAAFKTAVLRDPASVDAWFGWAQVCECLGRDKEAIAHYRKALDIQPDYAEAWSNLGNALSRSGDKAGAMAAYQEAKKHKSELIVARNNIAVQLAQAGRLQEAIAAFRETQQLQENAEGYYGLGHVYQDAGDKDAAQTAYRRALALRPDYPKAMTNLAILLMQEKEGLAEALGHLEKAVQLAPDLVLARFNLARVQMSLGKQQAAEANFREVLQREPQNANALANLGIVLCRQGAFGKALPLLQEALERDPQLVPARFNLAICQQRTGERTAALAGYRQVLIQQPQHPEALANLGIMLSREKPEEALSLLRRATQHKPDLAPAQFCLALLLAERMDLQGAEAAYRALLLVKADLAEALCNLGMLLMRSGRAREGVKFLSRGHRIGSSRTGWRYPSKEWLEQAQEKAQREEELLAILLGQPESKGPAEDLEVATFAYNNRRFTDAVKLYQRAFGQKPDLVLDLRRNYRFYAALAAAQAGCGRDAVAHPDAGERQDLRQQALAWLQADLEARQAAAQKEGAAGQAVLQSDLHRWLRHRQLVELRQPELAKLPEAERQAWEAFWKRIQDLLP